MLMYGHARMHIYNHCTIRHKVPRLSTLPLSHFASTIFQKYELMISMYIYIYTQDRASCMRNSNCIYFREKIGSKVAQPKRTQLRHFVPAHDCSAQWFHTGYIYQLYLFQKRVVAKWLFAAPFCLLHPLRGCFRFDGKVVHSAHQALVNRHPFALMAYHRPLGNMTYTYIYTMQKSKRTSDDLM